MNSSGAVAPTEQVYYEQPYLAELECEVISVEEKGQQCLVYLDRTIFFPEGGGQPCDQGDLIGPNGRVRVEQVRTVAGKQIVHQGKLGGQLAPGEQVHATLKWPARHKNMRVHSAGHLIHDVLMTMVENIAPTKGGHGQKAFLEYAGMIDPSIRETLEAKTNEVVPRDLTIVTRDATYEEIVATCRFVPPGLPKDKQLRIIQIGAFGPMPDGGVQVRSTREIGGIIIHSVTAEKNITTIRYGVKG